MKNLFSVNKTYNREANDYDENRYLAARVSDEIQNKLRNAFSVVTEETAPTEPTEEELALRKKSGLYWFSCLACFAVGCILFFFGDAIPAYQSIPALHLIDFALLIAAVVLHYKARRTSRRQASVGNEKVELNFAEATKRLEEAAAEAAQELGVPEDALSVDILPFHYRLKGSAPIPFGKKNHFDNLSVSLYVADGDLCLATAHELYRVPLSDVRGYRAYDEDFELDMWLKSEEFDSAKYAEYGIRKSGFFSCKAHGYFGVILGEDFEVWIPCYDFPQVKNLLNISEIS